MPDSKQISLLVYFILYFFTGQSQERIRVACVGNSITYGAFIQDREVNSFPAQLSTLLGPGYDVRNFGKSGATLLRKGNLPYHDTKEYQDALRFEPELVFIMLGTNDTKPVNRVFLNEFVNDYKELIASFRKAANKPRVVLMVPAPVFSKDSTGITASTLTELVIPMVRQTGYETGSELINMYNLLIESPQHFPDKVHPNEQGAAIFARRIYEFVQMQSDSSFSIKIAVQGGAKSFNFHGFQGFDFNFRSRNAKIVVPRRTYPGHPWVWRARFWGHEPQLDIALLERGFHIVYCDVAELYGNKEAISIWNDYYKLLTRSGLAKKSVMEGMSRGGVYVYRWATAYSNRVAAIYADAPVMDLKSWPGGKLKSKGSPEDWETFKKDFGLKTEKEAIAFKGNPMDLTKKITAAGFPMLHVVGDADDVVPVSENTAPFEQKIREAGGFIQVIHKPGVGHHPHSLQNPQPIVDFVLRATNYREVQNKFPVPSANR
jgi:lysophospholipase L1-like esterase/pimeloyl-ACP methyl ester carboxylesterase